MTSKIQPISPEIPWDVKTCLASNLEECETAEGVLVVGFEKEHAVFWSQAGLTREEMLWLVERIRFLLMNGTI